MRCFAGLYPADVAGMVLVDASHPDEERLTQEVLSQAERSREQQIEQRRERWDRISEALTLHLGIQRFAVATGLEHSRFVKEHPAGIAVSRTAAEIPRRDPGRG